MSKAAKAGWAPALNELFADAGEEGDPQFHGTEGEKPDKGMQLFEHGALRMDREGIISDVSGFLLLGR